MRFLININWKLTVLTDKKCIKNLKYKVFQSTCEFFNLAKYVI